jgi:hypothetical protein
MKKKEDRLWLLLAGDLRCFANQFRWCSEEEMEVSSVDSTGEIE